ncbi:hypothetical protein [Pontibacter pamirensis]|uniref:hypothetical protein n=1 Tax=Pontibacter pamirensis TaxID=2562824 RepID=UPI001389625F|nr:hypothetical protein [Pontibacter pamirensis]
MKSTMTERLEQVLKNERMTMEELVEKTGVPEWWIRGTFQHRDNGSINTILFRFGNAYEVRKVGMYLMGHSYDYDENGVLQPVKDQ